MTYPSFARRKDVIVISLVDIINIAHPKGALPTVREIDHISPFPLAFRCSPSDFNIFPLPHDHKWNLKWERCVFLRTHILLPPLYKYNFLHIYIYIYIYVLDPPAPSTPKRGRNFPPEHWREI